MLQYWINNEKKIAKQTKGKVYGIDILYQVNGKAMCVSPI